MDYEGLVDVVDIVYVVDIGRAIPKGCLCGEYINLIQMNIRKYLYHEIRYEQISKYICIKKWYERMSKYIHIKKRILYKQIFVSENIWIYEFISISYVILYKWISKYISIRKYKQILNIFV